MKRATHLTIFSLCFILLALNGFSQQTPLSRYKKEFSTIDSLALAAQPKLALTRINKLNELAKKDGNTALQIKSTVYSMMFQNYLEEDALSKIFLELQQDIHLAKQPAKSILQSLLAESYWKYYINNRYTIAMRGNRPTDTSSNVKTWSIKKIAKESQKLFLASLAEKALLQETKVALLSDVLMGDTATRYLRPSLYDLLAHRAIDAFLNAEIDVNPADHQSIDFSSPHWFEDTQRFTEEKIPENSDSFAAQTLLIFQNLIKYHAARHNNAAVADVDLKRLQFVFQRSLIDHKEKNYIEALKQLETLAADTDILADIWYQEATVLENQPRDPDSPNLNLVRAILPAQKAVNRFPNSLGGKRAAILIRQIESKSIGTQLNNFNLPQQPIQLLINYKNIDTAIFNLYRVNAEQNNTLMSDTATYQNFINTHQPIRSWKVSVPQKQDYQSHNLLDKIEPLPLGNYLLISKSDTPTQQEIPQYSFFAVTELTVVKRSLANRANQYYVANSKTGAAIKAASLQEKIVAYPNGKRQEKNGVPILTDENGFAISKENESVYNVQVSHGKDTVNTNSFNGNYFYNPPARKVIFFTDRPIYRPGQTVFYKGFYIQNENDQNAILPKQSLLVSFNDSNGKEIEKINVRTNEYGTFQGSFSIPTGKNNGQMQLKTQFGQTNIQVEEYKRSSFELVLDPLNKTYQLNDSIQVKGHALTFSGNSIAGTPLSYTISRTGNQWQSRNYRYNQPITIASGKTQTLPDGSFAFRFLAFADDAQKNKSYNYQIEVSLTDINGETKTKSQTIKVGKMDLVLKTSLPDQLFLTNEPEHIAITIANSNGQLVPASIQTTWSLLRSPDKLLRKSPFATKIEQYNLSKEAFEKNFPGMEYAGCADPKNWPVQKRSLTDTVKASNGSGTLVLKSAQLQAGYYRVKLIAISASNDSVALEKIIRIYPAAPVRILNMQEWLVPEKTTITRTETAVFRIAGALPAGKAFYEVYDQGHVIDKVWIETSPKQKTISIKPGPKLKHTFAVQFTMVQNGVVYNALQQVNLIDTTNALNIQFLTFRDKLQPGEKEKWTLKISNKKGEKEMAEMVATLYDASLDDMKKMDWPSIVNPAYGYDVHQWNFNQNNLNYSSALWFLRKNDWYPTAEMRKYEALNGIGINVYGNYTEAYKTYLNKLQVNETNNRIVRREISTKAGEQLSRDRLVRTVREIGQLGSLNESVVEDAKVYDFAAINYYDEKRNIYIVNGKPVPGPSNTIPRKNFNETAFFYPQLQTNEAGEIDIEFSIPESLTRYKMMGFAHTKDLKIGSTSRQLITQKQLSISMNAPRFFRAGDSILLSAKLNNLAGTPLTGHANLELRDAITGKIILLFAAQTKAQQEFKLADKGSLALTWWLVIPPGIEAITYKVTAQTPQYSDGEEMTIPVLQNSILVTESISLDVPAQRSKIFTMEKLLQSASSKTIKSQSLTLEFTSNPVWYAVQALPYLMEYPYDCAEQTLSRILANSFATAMVNSSAKIKAVFTQWQQQNNGAALQSPLEKNADLKSVLLEETPWVMQAATETERKRRLAVLFDLNRMSYELKNNLDKLEKMQQANGAFPWFNGMNEDQYITQHIALGMGQLAKLNLIDTKTYPAFTRILNKAINYLDKKLITNQTIFSKSTFLPLHYLYARSYTNTKSAEADFDRVKSYYLDQIKQNWRTMEPYQLAQSALMLHRNNLQAEAMKIIGLLKQTAQHHEEMGMYWTANKNGWFWYQNPIETQSLLIEAFDEVASDTASVAEMKTWLLKNKQANDWKTTKATAAACYALLMRGYPALDESNSPDIQLGKVKLQDLEKPGSQQEEGTGYQKLTIIAKDIKPEMGQVSIKNDHKTRSWGALHWQYFEKADHITAAGNGIQIKKQLFLKQKTATGNTLHPITANRVLKPGDLLTVQIEIHADREMEYLHLKDMRAAGFEPVNVISRYKYQDGLSYYESTRDAATNFFIGKMTKGVYVFEYDLRVNQAGNFSDGITSLQCMYAPEFNSHTAAIRVHVAPQ